MFEVLERLNLIQEKYGDSKFIEHCKVDGLYFILDNSKLEFYKINAKDTSSINADILNELKSYVFYEGTVDANKSIVIPDKKIASVTPHALIMKYKNYNDKDFEAFIIKHFTILKENYINSLDINELKKIFMSNREPILEILKENEVKDDDKINIFIRKDINEYEKDYSIYLSKKVFLKETYTKEINGELYGVPSFSLSLDDNKKTLSTNPYGKCNILFNLNEATLLNMIPKIKRHLNDIINDENLNVETKIDIKLGLNGTTKATEVHSYNIKELNAENKKLSFKEFNIVSSKFTSDLPVKYNLSKIELLNKIDKSIGDILFFTLNSQTSKAKINTNYLLLNTINKNIDDAKKQFLDFNNNDFISLFIGNKNTFSLFFNKNEEIDISKDIEKLLWAVYKYAFVKSTNHYKFDEFLDNVISILDYLKSNGGYEIMSTKIKDTWDRIVNFKRNKDLKFEILDDSDFFFIGGQLIKWLTLNSKAKDLNGSLLTDALNVKNGKELKDILKDKYAKYGYELYLNDKFFNSLYSSVMTYRVDENEKIKLSGNLEYIYQAGLIGDNIRFIKVKEEEDTDSKVVAETDENSEL